MLWIGFLVVDIKLKTNWPLLYLHHGQGLPSTAWNLNI